MKRSRYILVFLFLFTWLIGGLAISGGAVRAAQDPQFTAAATILKQSGTPGLWMFPDPPGFPPAKCTYYPSGINPNGLPVSMISASGPVIYSALGLDGQPIHVTYRLNQRWPDGSLHPKSEFPVYGSASQSTPMQNSTWFYTYDRGSTFALTVEIIWFFGSQEVGRIEILYTQYQSNISGSPGLPTTNACKPLYAATAVLGTSEGTVGSNIPFKIEYFPTDPNVGIYFDGKRLGPSRPIHGVPPTVTLLPRLGRWAYIQSSSTGSDARFRRHSRSNHESR